MNTFRRLALALLPLAIPLIAAGEPSHSPLIDEVRQALDGGRPMDLLDLVSLLMLATSAQQPVLRPA